MIASTKIQCSISWSSLRSQHQIMSSLHIISKSRFIRDVEIFWSHLTKIFLILIFSLSSNHHFRLCIFVWTCQRITSYSSCRQINLCMNFLLEVCFQIQQFLNTDHKFDNLVSQTIKDFVSEYIRNIFSFTIVTESRTRSDKFRKKTSQQFWSQIWAIDRADFRKVIVRLKKKADLFSSFSFHNRQIFKVSSSKFSSAILFALTSIFSSSTLKLSEILSSLNLSDQLSLIDRILFEKQKFRSFTSFILTSVSSSFQITPANRFFTNFDFTPRPYEPSQGTSPVFSVSNQSVDQASIIKSARVDSIENLESARLAKSTLQSKLVTQITSSQTFSVNNSETEFFRDLKVFSSKEKQSHRLLEEIQNSSKTQSFIDFIDMTFNARNVDFDNIDQIEFSSSFVN